MNVRTLRPLLLLVLFAMALLVPGGAAFTAPGNPGGVRPRFRPDRVLVSFRKDAALSARAATLQRNGLEPVAAPANPHFATLRLSDAARGRGLTVREVTRALRQDPTVRCAEPDYYVRAQDLPNDPRFAEQWSLRNTGALQGTPGADIHAEEAWNITTGSSSVVVAVLDTGVDYTHADLAANVLRDNADAVVGYDFANNTPVPLDDNDHGTHCAGILGAVGNNGTGITGVCQTVRIMPVKFLDADGYGTDSGAIQAIDFARTHGAQIISASWGGGDAGQLLAEAIRRAGDAGILFVAAAGNDGSDNDETPFYPANLNRELDNVVSVAATDRTDALAYFSNFGADSVDLAAPGVDILSTIRGSTYRSFSGTSMACPHVAGVAALIKARYPGATAAQIKARLIGGADRLPGLLGLVSTGRLNAAAALVSDSTPPAAPAGFSITARGETTLQLSWTAPGDDGNAGTAILYEMRYDTAPLTAGNPGRLASRSHLPSPLPAGTQQSCLLPGLQPGAAYYVSLRAYDRAGNGSELALAGPVTTLPGTSEILMLDDAEGTPRFAGPAPWSISTEQAFGGTHAYTDSAGVPYHPNVNSALAQQNPVLITTTSTQLSFEARTDLEYGYDGLVVELSTNGGGTWLPTSLVLTGSSDWTYYALPVGQYVGQQLLVRFHLYTDFQTQQDGVWLDDIRIQTDPLSGYALADNVEGAAQFSGAPPWAVSGEYSFGPGHAYTDSPGQLYADNADTSLSQQQSVLLTGLVPELRFFARTSLEYGYDFVYPEVSTDGGVGWKRLPLTLTGEAEWAEYRVSLSRYFGESVKVRFHLLTDTAGEEDGIWLDDIRICGERLVPVSGPDTFAVSGRVRRPDGTPLPGITVSAGGGFSAVTAADGGYVLRPLPAGDVTITAERPGYTFAPASRAYSPLAGDLAGQDFTATALLNTVTGTVLRADSTPLAGVEVRTNGGLSTLSGADGGYTLSNIPTGNVTVSASLRGFAFSPPSYSYLPLTSDRPGQNFVATAVPVPEFHLGSATIAAGQREGLGLALQDHGQPVYGARFDLRFDPTKVVVKGIKSGSLPAGVHAYLSLASPGLARCIISGGGSGAWSNGEVARILVKTTAGFRKGHAAIRVVLPGGSTGGAEVTGAGGAVSSASATPGRVTARPYFP